MTSNLELELVSGLSCNRSSEKTYKTLVEIRTKFIKQTNGIRKFRELGGIKLLLPLIQKPNVKIVDISLSILGNCCLEKETRREVKILNGITALVTILKYLDAESILNRACRTIANLALDNDIAETILTHDVFPFIVKFLHSTQDSYNQQTAIRTLRILACTPKHRDDLVKCDGVRFTAELLSSSDDQVRLCSVRAIAHFTQHCSEQCAQQVHEGQGVQELVNLASHETDCVQESAIVALVNLAHQSCVRPIIGNMGAVQVFIKHSQVLTESDSVTAAYKKVPLMAAEALCLCCREAVNRVRIRESGGLKILLFLLVNEVNRTLHEQALNNLLNFLYDDLSLDILLELGLIPALIEKLAKYINENPREHEKSWNMHQMEKKAEVIDERMHPKSIVLSSNTITKIQRTSVETFTETYSSDLLNKKRLETSQHNVNQFQNVEETNKSSDKIPYKHSIQSHKTQVYHINSPSYQEIRNELMELVKVENELQPIRDTWNHWSPGSMCYSPENSPPRTCSPKTISNVYTTNFINAVSNDAKTSPGSTSPDWNPRINNELSPHGQSTLSSVSFSLSTHVNSKYSFSCGSPMSVSPVTPSPTSICYSPVCEEYSEEEEEDEENNPPEVSASYSGSHSSSNPLLLQKEVIDNVKSSENDIIDQDEDNLLMFHESANEKMTESPCGNENSFETRLKLDFECDSFPLNYSKSNLSSKLRSRTVSTTSDSADEMGNSWWQQDICNIESGYVSHLMMLLSRFSQMEKPNSALLTASCIETLLNALVLTPRPISRAGRILKRLARNPLCLQPLIIIRFPLLVFSHLQSHQHESCNICSSLDDLAESLHSTLSMQAEAPFGIGVLAHMLAAGTESEKIAASLMTPYLLRNNVKSLRRKIMIEYGGLEIIASLLEKPEDKEHSIAVQSLVKISDYLNPASLAKPISIDETFPEVKECCYIRNEKYHDFLFVLDSKAKLYANRSVLSKSSAVFSAMLTGGFSESSQKEVKICDVSVEALSYIVHYLYGCRYSGVTDSSNFVECPVTHVCSVDLLLEVLSLSDRLLLPELKKWIETFIRNSVLKVSNAIQVYTYARSHNCEDLAILILEYLLGNSISSAEKETQLTKLLKSKIKEIALSDIKEFINRYL